MRTRRRGENPTSSESRDRARLPPELLAFDRCAGRDRRGVSVPDISSIEGAFNTGVYEGP